MGEPPMLLTGIVPVLPIMPETTPSESPSRYVVGIDLGTTNSALAFVDADDPGWAVQNFSIPQLIAPATVESRQTLPSFHYEGAGGDGDAGEAARGAFRLPWSGKDEAPKNAVGVLARDHGAAVPGRLVVSAKSWLSHSGVDRTAGLLPWHGAADVERLSPLEASARYLAHMRAAWDHAHPRHPLAKQSVILTVPASFDEVARELTLEAAKLAGLVQIVLLEEPQAAFYAWIDAHRDDWHERVQPGQTILVCDVGGGTTDLTLIRVRPAKKAGEKAGDNSGEDQKVIFHRIAVGEHLILGGDNLDLALAHHIENRLASSPEAAAKLSPNQFGLLLRACRQVKETLLGENPPERLTINIPGSGSKLIGTARQLEVTREEVCNLLVEGFLPRVGLHEKPMSRRSGFQEFGLPYAPDPAITRYLAAFLTAHRDRENSTLPAARPDLVLFNGGLFESPVLRQRLLEVLGSWFDTPGSEKVTVLPNARLDLAVARGAAYYGMVRRGLGVRISGGLAHSYYIGVQSADGENAAICLLPAGVEEGQTIELADRTFDLLIRQPAEFGLYVSSTRTTDPPGMLLPIDREQLTPLPPIRTVLQARSRETATSVRVYVHARLNEIGTLEVGCREVQGSRRWKLQFDVRSATRADIRQHEGNAETQGIVDEELIQQSGDIIRATFASAANEKAPPASLIKRIEQAINIPRLDWPASFMRSLWDVLMEVEPARRLSIEHEARWLNLTGFCLRPGYGLAADDWRVGRTWPLLNGKINFPRNESCRAEWWVFWRRLAGGLSRGQQQTLADPLLAAWRTYHRKMGTNFKWNSPTFQFGPHESAEAWRLLGSLELLAPATKIELANLLLEILSRKGTPAQREAGFTALGRFGARVPIYGPLNELVSSEVAEEWAQRVMTLNPAEERAAFAVVQLTHRTGDRHRDVSESLRQSALAWLIGRSAPEHYLDLVRDGGQLRTEEQRIVLGDSLPRGLMLN